MTKLYFQEVILVIRFQRGVSRLSSLRYVLDALIETFLKRGTIVRGRVHLIDLKLAEGRPIDKKGGYSRSSEAGFNCCARARHARRAHSSPSPESRCSKSRPPLCSYSRVFVLKNNSRTQNTDCFVIMAMMTRGNTVLRKERK